MARKDERELEVVTLRLVKGDKEILQEFYPEIGYNRVVRELVSRAAKRLREKYARQEQQNDPTSSGFASGGDLDGHDLGALQEV